jgi:hypothetical protein
MFMYEYVYVYVTLMHCIYTHIYIYTYIYIYSLSQTHIHTHSRARAQVPKGLGDIVFEETKKYRTQDAIRGQCTRTLNIQDGVCVCVCLYARMYVCI